MKFYNLIFLLNISFLSLYSMQEKVLQNSKTSSVWDIYSKDQSIKKGDKSFINDCNSLNEENQKIPLKKSNTIRIATYNVHFWTDSQKVKNYDGILKIISKINADILILQEVVLFDKKIAEDFKKMGYKYQSFCRTQKRWVFGNMILSKYPLSAKPIVKVFEIDKKLGREQRCFINYKIKLPNSQIISIYGTHLDVYDKTENQRLAEINELIQFTNFDKSKNILIAGDFNSVRKQDYQYKIGNELAWDLYSKAYKNLTGHEVSTKALDALAKEGFKDCFSFANIAAPKFTVWSGTIVDFIFLNKKWNLPIAGCYTLYNSESDHLPIFMDVEIKIKSKL